MAHKGLSPDAVVKAAVELIDTSVRGLPVWNVPSERGRDAGNRGMAWRRGRAVSGRNVPQFCEGAPGTLLADHEYGGKR